MEEGLLLFLSLLLLYDLSFLFRYSIIIRVFTVTVFIALKINTFSLINFNTGPYLPLLMWLRYTVQYLHILSHPPLLVFKAFHNFLSSDGISSVMLISLSFWSSITFILNVTLLSVFFFSNVILISVIKNIWVGI